MTGLEYHPDLLGPALTNGVATASLYGLMAVSLILVYRINRSVAFVQGGMATCGGFLYWWIAAEPAAFATKGLPRGAALIVVVLFGAATGALFGRVVSGRLATFPRVTVTTFGLGAALFAIGLVSTLWQGVQGEIVPPAVYGKVRVGTYYVAYQQILGLAICVAVCVGLTVLMRSTRAGVYVRAIADDAETAEMTGIRVSTVGMAVWTGAGAIGALSGALLMPMTTLQHFAVMSLLMRSLAAAVLGGFGSFPLGIAGALVLGVVESVVGAGVFGTVGTGVREVAVMSTLMACVLLLRRRGVADLRAGL